MNNPTLKVAIFITITVIIIAALSGGAAYIYFQRNSGDRNAANSQNDQIKISNKGSKSDQADNNTDQSDTIVLKNIGVNIEPWDKETNTAGDLIFTKKVLFEDAYILNTKVFAEFGEDEHLKSRLSQSVEYWYFLQPGTKVMAAADGKVRISYIDHTQDWAVNISQSDSIWMVGQEHIVNLKVKDGDTVKAGDILGDASPHTSFGANMAFTELSVWTGGSSINKYCPFDFLEESLKPVYETKLLQVAADWEEFIGKDIYDEDEWVRPGCLVEKIVER